MNLEYYSTRSRDLTSNSDYVLQLFNKDQPIVPYLLSKHSPCDKNFVIINKLGSGQQAKIYQVKIKGQDKLYVAKKFSSYEYILPYNIYQLIDPFQHPEFLNLTNQEFISLALKIIQLDNRISVNDILEWNNLKPNEQVTFNLEFKIPSAKFKCLVEQSFILKSVVIHRGDYLCLSNNYTEYLISLLLSNLVETGQSIHFLHTFDFSTCPYDHQLKQYMFTELVDGPLFNLSTISDIDYEATIFGVLHSIYLMTKLYQINHNDLHGNNVFIKILADKSLANGIFLHYKIDNHDYYLPAPTFIIKIADLGLAVKYSTPKILSYDVLNEEYSVIPTRYTYGFYDLFLFLYNIYEKWGLKDSALSVYQYVYDKTGDIKSYAEINSYSTWRGRLDERKLASLNLKSIDESLFTSVFKKYQNKPTSGLIYDI